MNIKVIINNEEVEVVRGTTLLELSKKYKDDYKYEIILAKVDGEYKELVETITKECEIEFFDLTNHDANAVYLNGLKYVTLYAFKRTFGYSSDIIVRHSLDKGLYIETTTKITEEDIKKIEEEMKKIVAENIPIQRVIISKLEAMKYYNSIKYNSKARIIKYNTSPYLLLYKLGNLYDYFYSLMPVDTSVLSHFELTYFNENGFILRFPTIYMQDGIKEFEARHNIYNLYTESRKWAKKLGLENAGDLNSVVEKG